MKATTVHSFDFQEVEELKMHFTTFLVQNQTNIALSKVFVEKVSSKETNNVEHFK